MFFFQGNIRSCENVISKSIFVISTKLPNINNIFSETCFKKN